MTKFVYASASSIYGDAELPMSNDVAGEVFNVGGGSRISVNELIDEIEKVIFNKDYVCIYEMPCMWWRTKEKGGKE